MFLSGLDREHQEAFLNLAYTMVYADGRLDDREQKLFDSYKLEVDIDLTKAHNIDFEKEIAKFDDCTTVQKMGVFYELYAIALIDESYPEQEQKLVEIMKKRFGITDAKMQEMHDGLKELSIAYEKLAKIVKS